MNETSLNYPPEQSLSIGIAVLVVGTALFFVTLLLTRWLASRDRSRNKGDGQDS